MDTPTGLRCPEGTCSKQADAPEKLLKATVGAIAIKDRIDGEVSHPDSALIISGLQPFECVLLLI